MLDGRRLGKDQQFVSSDTNAFALYTKDVVYLDNNEIAVVKREKVEFFDANLKPITKQHQTLSFDAGMSLRKIPALIR